MQLGKVKNFKKYDLFITLILQPLFIKIWFVCKVSIVG